MPDVRFFTRSSPKTLGELAQLAGADIGSGSDSGRLIYDVAPLDKAGSEHIAFLDNVKYRDAFKVSQAGACIVAPDMASFAPAGMGLIITPSPYKAYAQIAQNFYPETYPAASVSEHARVHASAVIGKSCIVSDGVVIAEGAEIGDGTWIEPNSVIGRNVKIGEGCRIGANCVISHTVMGDHVRIYPGCCIGQDGFGFAIDPKGFFKIPQLGRVLIENGVEIGAGCTIDRGAGPDTVIGQGTWMDNLIQIGHNVKVGKGCIIAAQCGISGSTVLEDYVVMGGQVGIAGHLRIGKGARIGAQSGVVRDIPAGEEQMGYLSIPLRQFYKQNAYLNRLMNKK